MVFVVQAAVVKGRGGITTAVAHYERMFREMGVPSAVVFAGPARDALEAQGFDIIDAPALLTSPLARVLPAPGTLRSALAQRIGARHVVVIVHSDRTLPQLRRLLPQAQFITPCHSDKFKHKSGADLVITLNAAQHGLAKRALPRTRVAMLGNPYVGSQTAPLGSGGRVRFNVVARFIPTKDPLTVLRAATLLSPSTPPLRFFGAGPLEAELREAARASNLAAEFPGWVSEPFSQFHRNDVLVLASHWEGLPYLLQEALDHGVAIIAADNAGNRAALAEGAFGALFPIGDAQALARAMGEAVADLDALRSRAEKGRAALTERFGASVFWQRLLQELKG